MSKRKKLERKRRELEDFKTIIASNIKRYCIILLFASPIIFFVSYVLENETKWFNGAVSFLLIIAMLLLSFLIGMIIFKKIDDKQNDGDEERLKDPFAD